MVTAYFCFCLDIGYVVCYDYCIDLCAFELVYDGFAWF